jgi:hypothetical protein
MVTSEGAAMSPVPRDVMSAEVRAAIERHDEWDAMHEFVTLHWDGEHLSYGTVGIIDPAFHPTQYGKLMARLAAEQIGREPGKPPYAYLLQIEGFGVPEPPPSATDEERAQFNRDRIGRTFHQRADAHEFAQAWCADIHGRLWSATKRRDRPDDIQVKFYRPGAAPSGQMIEALLAVAAATGSLQAGAN